MKAEDNRTSDSLDDRADRLMQSALTLIPEGQWKKAAEALQAAACLHAAAGRTYDEARCLQFAATLTRFGGNAAGALSLAQRACSTALDDLPLTVSIHAEAAESAFAEGRTEQALAEWTLAIDHARRAQYGPEALNALLRRRAMTRVALGQTEAAGTDFDEAYALLAAARDVDTALFVRIEQAALLLQYDDTSGARRVLAALGENMAASATSAHLRAELGVLRARLARADGDMAKAADDARQARAAALEANAPVSYFAAAVELAHALQAQGDRSGTYSALATAWATISDALGKDVARSWVEPCLLAYKVYWGDEAFQRAKAEYEAERRAARLRQES